MIKTGFKQSQKSEWRPAEPWRKTFFALNLCKNYLQSNMNELVSKSCISSIKTIEDKYQWHGLVTKPTEIMA